MNVRRVLPVLGVVIVALGAVMWSGSTAKSAQQGDDQNVVVHLSKYTTDLHGAFMAFKLANAMQELGAEVTILLDLEGVRLADARVPLNMMWGTAHEPLSKHYEDFVAGGGKIVLCPHCAMAVGVDKDNVREGAAIGIPEEGTIPNLLLAADKILDY